VKRVIVTGSAGLLGHHLVQFILDKTDWQVFGLDYFENKRISSERFLQTERDLRMQLRMNWVKPDIIFNCASRADVSASLEDPRSFIRDNVEMVITMLDFARDLPDLQRFIHVSTAEVYGPNTSHNDFSEWYEGDRFMPTNPYAASKCAQEAIATSYAKSYKLPITIMNTQNIFGEYQPENKFIPSTVKKLLKGEEIEVHDCYRKWIHAESLSKIMLMVAGIPMATPRFKIHAAGEKLPNEELVCLIAQILNVKAKIKPGQADRPGHEKAYLLDCSRLSSIGGTPQDFCELLGRTVRHYAGL